MLEETLLYFYWITTSIIVCIHFTDTDISDKSYEEKYTMTSDQDPARHIHTCLLWYNINACKN